MKVSVPIVAALATTAAASPWCYYHAGRPCWKRNALPEPAADAAPEANAEPWSSWSLHHPNGPYKRSLDAIVKVARSKAPEDVPVGDADDVAFLAEMALHNLIGLAADAHGSPKDYFDSIGFTPTDGKEIQRRAATIDPPKEKRWCYYHPNRPCWKVRRAAEEFLKEARGVEDMGKLAPVARAAHEILETF
ncbi:hypothetical protein VHEMI09338 [[Torrubiella] hemipterigena]|uniref:Uncharacterized protein n=1 Tax=[Torrubiella] hemipterigena TaxID=1531966 RepID=A0A0A1TG51_9HYPO|nr:hypothetical protein VHEMI09338 [[Torrubiella] hemipterigena]